MKVLLPWNMASYIPMNGFHPLYQVVSEIKGQEFRFEVPKQKLSHELYHKFIAYEIDDLEASYYEIPQFIAENGLESNWRRFISNTERRIPEELFYVSSLSTDVEFHHTAPLTLGERPFILHVESFMPTFFPFLQQGKPFQKELLQEVIPVYKALFESEVCLGIYSHVTETLQQFSRFFDSTIINEKLHQTAIDLSDDYIAPDQKKGERPRIIFLSSAHQGNTFYLRGGFVLLNVALLLLKDGFDIEVYFRCPKPEIDEFKQYKFNYDDIITYENKNIFWDERFLEQSELNRLIASSDFLAIPSVNLHSVSILSALANGVIPIVSDTIGTDLYIQNESTGIVLEGVRREVWKESSDFKITYDDHSAFINCHEHLVEQLQNKLINLLTDKNEIRRRQHHCKQHFSREFGAKKFSRWLTQLFEDLSHNKIKINNHYKDYFDQKFSEKLSPNHFGGPTDKKIIEYIDGEYVSFRLGCLYLVVPTECYSDFLENKHWSYMNLFHACHEQSDRFEGMVQIFDNDVDYQTYIERCKVNLKRRSFFKKQKGRVRSFCMKLKKLRLHPNSIASYLSRWPFLYSIAKVLWQIPKLFIKKIK